MAPKAAPPAAPSPSPVATSVDDDQLDNYEEGEEEEPEKSIIKVEMLAALNVWASEPGDAKSKVGITIQFPGEPPPEAPPEMEAFLPDVVEEEEEDDPVAPSPPPPAAAVPAKPGEAAAEPPPPPPPPPRPPANFTLGTVVREFERTPEYPLYHQLLHEPMVVTVHWISPSGAMKAPLATAKVDLTALLNLDKKALELSCALEPYVEPPPPPPPPPPGAKKAAPAKPPPPPKKGAAPAEAKPAMLEGATLKLKMATSIPLLSEDDRKEGFVMEISVVTVRSLPPKVIEFGTAATPDPFSYTCGFTIPGFSGPWWNSLTSIEAAAKDNLATFKATSSAVEKEEVTILKPIVIPEDKSAGPRELKNLLFGGGDGGNNSMTNSCREMEAPDAPVLDEYGYPPEPETITEIRDILKWKETAKRFVPSQGANELRDKIKKKEYFRGAVARYVKQESYDVFSDPFFARYRSSFDMDLMTFQEQEGLSCFAVPCPLGDYVEAPAGPVLCPPDERPPSKKAKPIEDDSGPPPPAPAAAKGKAPPTPAPEAPPLVNAWKQAASVIFVTIKTSQPIEPVWKPPPEPELKVENIIPVRPKAPNLHETVKIATEKFKEFVQVAAHDISYLHQRAVEGEQFEQPLGAEALPTTKSSGITPVVPIVPSNSLQRQTTSASTNEIESKAAVRRKVVQELHRSGAWQQMRDEMKSRVLKIAAEKFRLGKKDAITTGKFEFCNALYVKLMEEVHACLADMFLKRQRAAMPLGSKDDKPLSEKEKKLLHLRQLADEYEYDYDYRTANKFHQDRLLGGTIHDPNIWFEYGCFCMRTKEKGRPRDRGKAEECFREALTLDNRHLFSLLALACLMWHRGYFTQSEVLLRTAIELHPEEEFIPWCILSQIHQAQGQKENVKSCLKKAEILYKSARENRNSYSTPHILLSHLLKFPFSVGYLFLKENLPHSTVFVDTSLLLLDLHLPKEGRQILDLECDVFSTAVDNKWAQAKAHELMKEYRKAEIWLKENLSITKEEPMSWLLMGRSRYVSKEFAPALEAYEKHLRYQGTKEVYPYVYLDIGNCHLQLKNYMAAKKVFLKVCSIGPNTSSWLGAGIAFFRMCDFKHAEIALVEGNHIDSKNQKIWAYLTLTCLALDRCDEAEISFQQMQKTELTDVPLLLEIADGFAKFGNYRDAEAAVMDALKEEDGRVSARFKLADLYLQQGKLECARLEYENILELDDISCPDRNLAECKHNDVQAQIFFANQPTSERRVTI